MMRRPLDPGALGGRGPPIANFSSMHWSPLRFALSKLLGQRTELFALAVETRMISPRVVHEAPPAVFEAFDFERITACEAMTTLPEEHRRARGGLVEHGGTVLYRLPDALVSRNHIYAGAARLRTAPPRGPLEWPPLPAAEESRERTGLWCGSLYAATYFGHWLSDQLTTELLAEELGLPAFAGRRPRYFHEEGLRRAAELYVNQVDTASFEALWIADDLGQNDSKRARYSLLRGRLRAGAAPEKSRGVLLLRGRTGQPRVLVNEQELAEHLAREGFAIVDPQRASAEELRDVLHDAPLVIGVEGSHLMSGIMLAPKRSCLVVIQPPNRFTTCLKDMTDAIGQRYAFTVGSEVEGGFRCPVRRLFRLLERVERSAPRLPSEPLPRRLGAPRLRLIEGSSA